MSRPQTLEAFVRRCELDCIGGSGIADATECSDCGGEGYIKWCPCSLDRPCQCAKLGPRVELCQTCDGSGRTRTEGE